MNTVVKVNGHPIEKVKMKIDTEQNHVVIESDANKARKIDLENNVVVICIYGEFGEHIFPNVTIAR